MIQTDGFLDQYILLTMCLTSKFSDQGIRKRWIQGFLPEKAPRLFFMPRLDIMTNGAKLAVAAVACATPLFLPHPKIIYINVLHFVCPAPDLFSMCTTTFKLGLKSGGAPFFVKN